MKKIKLLIILVLLVSCIPKLIAQKANVVSGGNSSGSGGSISYSIGQIDYNTTTSSSGTISQGVQQPFEIFTLGNDNFPEITLQVQIYPNPTSSYLNLIISNYSIKNLEYQIVDFNGKQIQSKKIENESTQIHLEDFPTAIYLLEIVENNQVLKTFKIIKNN